MKSHKHNFRKGAASFYVVAFSTLILVVIVASFATTMISEVTRTSNDDLSQSAYDSALAGVEDAKAALANYQRCLEAGTSLSATLSPGTEITCDDIVYWMQHPDCDMVAHMLGRLPKGGQGEVAISDSLSAGGGAAKTDVNQAYTCVEIDADLDDYRFSLSPNDSSHVVKAEFENNVEAGEVGFIRINWYTGSTADSAYQFVNNINDGGKARSIFKPVKNSADIAAPPVLEVQLIQTAPSFTLAQFDRTQGDTTNHAVLYLVPSNDKDFAKTTNEYQIGTYNGSANVITQTNILKSNDMAIKNLPHSVWCSSDASSEFACTAILELPYPVGSNPSDPQQIRSNETFMLSLALPYGQPETDFSIEFCNRSKPDACKSVALSGTERDNSIIRVNNSQVSIDSTGRANDLYRRVEVRMESADTAFAYPQYAIQLLGKGTDNILRKDMTVTSEHNLRIDY